jgi:hypothetical protein
MKYRLIAAAVILLILLADVFINPEPANPTAPQGSSQPAAPAKEDEAMRNLKL